MLSVYLIFLSVWMKMSRLISISQNLIFVQVHICSMVAKLVDDFSTPNSTKLCLLLVTFVFILSWVIFSYKGDKQYKIWQT